MFPIDPEPVKTREARDLDNGWMVNGDDCSQLQAF
jgi:hypothetical protein